MSKIAVMQTLMSGRCDSLRRRALTASRCRNDYTYIQTAVYIEATSNTCIIHEISTSNSKVVQLFLQTL